jgi:cytochrome c oxidase subunit 2
MTTTAVVDNAFIYIMVFCFLLFAAIIFFTVFFAVRYRRSRNPNPADISGNPLLEGAAIGVMLLLVLPMFIYGLTGFKFLRTAPAGSMNVTVTARQWSWLFTYENGKKSTDLVVPQGRDIALTMVSTDVIHGFFAPAYRIKQDVVPGMKTRAWFKAASLGASDILCTQYCGLQHSKMLSMIYVIPPADFDSWYAGQEVEIEGLTSQAERPEGEGLLRQNGCTDCHSLDGTKRVGPTFKGLLGASVRVTTAGKERAAVADSAYIAKSIVDPSADIAVGYEDIMPAGRGLYTDEQLREISDFIGTLK